MKRPLGPRGDHLVTARERPILFSAPMVRALLEGKKTQTRRAVKANQGIHCPNEMWPDALRDVIEWREQNGRWFGLMGYRTLADVVCPYGAPGDRLWVREAWWQDKRDPTVAVMDADGACRYSPNDPPARSRPEHVADLDALRRNAFWRKRPSIHMPRWASRITLEITDVRVQRLQAIGEADSYAEGIQPVCIVGCSNSEADRLAEQLARSAFRNLWESINGSDSWAANPWVWAITFRRL